MAVVPVYIVLFEHFSLSDIRLRANGSETATSTTLDEPLRSLFRSIAVRYLVVLWILSGAGLVVLIGYATRRIGFSYSIVALATVLVLTGAATLVRKAQDALLGVAGIGGRQTSTSFRWEV